jgi:hypothetical protein
MGAVSADLAGMARKTGFTDVAAGYQDAAFGPPQRSVQGGFNQPNKGGYKSWYMMSARKPVS